MPQQIFTFLSSEIKSSPFHPSVLLKRKTKLKTKQLKVFNSKQKRFISWAFENLKKNFDHFIFHRASHAHKSSATKRRFHDASTSRERFSWKRFSANCSTLQFDWWRCSCWNEIIRNLSKESRSIDLPNNQLQAFMKNSFRFYRTSDFNCF